jgi:pimeloyl-ACP methyl ester carboxylesterase
LIRRVGILDRSTVTEAEVDAYRHLALGDDRGAAYLEIMRGLDVQREARRDYGKVVRSSTTPYPVQVIWGANDPILSMRRYGWRAMRSAGLSSLAALPARHFLQEDQAPAVAELITRHAAMERHRVS